MCNRCRTHAFRPNEAQDQGDKQRSNDIENFSNITATCMLFDSSFSFIVIIRQMRQVAKQIAVQSMNHALEKRKKPLQVWR